MNDLSGFQRDILIVTAGLDDPHGLAIKEELGEVYPSDVHHGRLYPNLDKLVEAGFIEKGTKDKRTNEYRLTDEGRAAIREYNLWMNRYVETPAEA